jgi:hypothetical protein
MSFFCSKATPWAHYKLPNATYHDGVWEDSSGNNRHATSATVSHPIVSHRTLQFSATQGLRFPSGSIPIRFTILIAARYTGSVKGKILQAVESDWLLGSWDSNNGVGYFGRWVTSEAAPTAHNADTLFHKFAGSNRHTLPTVWMDNHTTSIVSGLTQVITSSSLLKLLLHRTNNEAYTDNFDNPQSSSLRR